MYEQQSPRIYLSLTLMKVGFSDSINNWESQKEHIQPLGQTLGNLKTN